jgi:pimeloyl-ACP methyl ester carboxylesterase
MVQANFGFSLEIPVSFGGEPSMQPVTRYAKSGDVHVAYQVFGEGPVNLVLAPPFVSNIENYWTFPGLERWLLRLASFARVVMFDKRGTGCRIGSPSFRAWTSALTTCGRSWTPPAWINRPCLAYRKAVR